MDYGKIDSENTAIKTIKRMIADGEISQEIAEKYFPELKESEDERIRKALMQNLKERFGTKGNMGKGLDMPDVLAWLEKQGEQKPTNWFQELEDKLANATPKQLAEWKEKYFKEEPAEWSEEDETTKNNISHIIRQYDKISKRENEPCWYIGDCLLWMQNIKGRVQPQPKPIWSGGDEAHLHSLITHLEQWIERHPNTTGADIQGENITWIKSLRPQSAWKPSKEQLIALRNQCIDKKSTEEGALLCDLFTDLKKLIEKY